MALKRDEYEEKRCLLNTTDPENETANRERIPIRHVVDKLDRALARGDYAEGMRLLDYWTREARALCDEDGELSVTSEMLGLSRRTNDREKGLAAIDRALELLDKSGLSDTVSGATILLNAATTRKHFGDPRERSRSTAKPNRFIIRGFPPTTSGWAGCITILLLRLPKPVIGKKPGNTTKRRLP